MQKKFKTVVVFRRDRLARRVDDLIEIKNTFKKLGIRIIYSNKGEFQPDPSSYISSFVENIIMSVDELEPSILAERIASGKREKRERGEYVCGGKNLYGFKRIGNNGKTYYKSVENEAIIIKKIYEMYLSLDEDNPNYDTLVNAINALSSSKQFTMKEITNIILKPVYGKKLILKERDDEGHKIYTKDLLVKSPETGQYTIDMAQLKTCINVDDIVDEQTWCNTVLKWRRITPERTIIPEEERNYLFKGLLKCGICKQNIYLSRGYYICAKSHLIIKDDLLVDLLLEKFINDTLTYENIDDYYKSQVENLDEKIKEYNDKIVESRKSQNKLILEIIEQYSPTNKDVIKNAKLETYINEEKQEKKAISNLKDEAVTLKVAIDKLRNIVRINNTTLLISMLKRNIDTTQYFLSSIIQEVTVAKDGRNKIKYKHNKCESSSLSQSL
jgi:DNA invertase Pin-like site-specific DNA recombinase